MILFLSGFPLPSFLCLYHLLSSSSYLVSFEYHKCLACCLLSGPSQGGGVPRSTLMAGDGNIKDRSFFSFPKMPYRWSWEGRKGNRILPLYLYVTVQFCSAGFQNSHSFFLRINFSFMEKAFFKSSARWCFVSFDFSIQMAELLNIETRNSKSNEFIIFHWLYGI